MRPPFDEYSDWPDVVLTQAEVKKLAEKISEKHRHTKKVRQCYKCGTNPAAGYASVTKDGVKKWYCHEDGATTCYEMANIELALENLRKNRK